MTELAEVEDDLTSGSVWLVRKCTEDVLVIERVSDGLRERRVTSLVLASQSPNTLSGVGNHSGHGRETRVVTLAWR